VKVPEKIKIQIGADRRSRDSSRRHVSTRKDLLTGKPKQVDVSYREIAKD
jgi:actin-like ATPase involved in cell morphogenesis